MDSTVGHWPSGNDLEEWTNRNSNSFFPFFPLLSSFPRTSFSYFPLNLPKRTKKAKKGRKKIYRFASRNGREGTTKHEIYKSILHREKCGIKSTPCHKTIFFRSRCSQQKIAKHNKPIHIALTLDVTNCKRPCRVISESVCLLCSGGRILSSIYHFNPLLWALSLF